MEAARIAALLEPFLEQPIPEPQLNQISIYIDLLQRWNARINLTAIRNEEEIVTRHFGESLFLARHLFPAVAEHCHPERSEGSSGGAAGVPARPPSTGNWQLATGNCPPRVLDIGSGAGFPALPLKLWAPNIHLTLIESNHKKAVFLREVARALTLTNINVLTGRAQALAPSLTSQADVVTLRAVERLETVLPKAVTFLAPKGTLALLITTPQIPQVLTLTTLKWQAQINVPKSRSRVLLIGYQA
jgi:16S rRNA (guanine527-N7)-methyltransferase